MNSRSLFSRLVFLLAAIVVLGLSYWFVETSLAPVDVPPAPTVRRTVSFDPTLDVSKNETFFRLHPLGPTVVQPTAMGRLNPFIPAPTSTPSNGAGATTTSAASSTPSDGANMTTSTP